MRRTVLLCLMIVMILLVSCTRSSDRTKKAEPVDSSFPPGQTIMPGGVPLATGKDLGFITYAGTPDAVESQTYKMTVNGQPVFVEKFKDISYARFAVSREVPVQIAVLQDFKGCTVSPQSYSIPLEKNGNELSFKLTSAKKLILQCDGLEKLFIFADPPEQNAPRSGQANVTNVMNYVKDNTGAVNVGKDIQKGIDELAARPGGGVLYFPNGKYVTGTIVVKANVTLYLESGALLQSTDNPLDFYTGAADKASDVGKRGQGAFIYFANADNAKILGRGTIALQGTVLRKKSDVHFRVIEVFHSNKVEVQDVVIRDSAGFNIHIYKSQDVLMKGYKIVNDINLSNQDGTDPNSSRNVLIEDVFMYTADDAIAVKADAGLCKDIVIRNSVFWTKKSALKVGSDPYYGAENIVFENNDVIQADRMLALYAVTGYIDGVKYINNKSEAIKLKGLGKLDTQQLIVFEVSDKNCCSEPSEQVKETKIKDRKTSYINNVLIDGYYAYVQSPKSSTIKGLDNITFTSSKKETE